MKYHSTINVFNCQINLRLITKIMSFPITYVFHLLISFVVANGDFDL